MAMPNSDNILAIGGDKRDRLTHLPINVIHQIQDNISIEDAARMSVLSRTWRYIWASKPKLVFDTHFCIERLPSNTIDTISTILFQHHGSIKIFSVDISVIHSSQHLIVDPWMQFLSRNGLMNLTIENKSSGNTPYKLPSYVYAVELQHLSLSNCIFTPPCHFRGFSSSKCCDLHEFPMCILFLASGTGKDSPPMRLTRLRCLYLYDYDFDSEDQTFALLSILRSSPNIKKLQFHGSSQRNQDDMAVDVNSSQGPDYKIRQLSNLQIFRFRGSRAELLFISFILASAPLLQKAFLLVDASVNESQSLKISKELMRFPRASPKAEIIYEPWSGEQGRLVLQD